MSRTRAARVGYGVSEPDSTPGEEELGVFVVRQQ
jgi:hypothetical protein